MPSPVLASCFLLLVPTSALSIAITGTNSGIGQEAAKILLASGHEVYHACRNGHCAEPDEGEQTVYGERS